MTHTASSAIPPELISYADKADQMNDELSYIAAQLRAVLRRLRATCTEFPALPGEPGLADNLVAYVNRIAPTDRWVRQVAFWFQQADSSSGLAHVTAVAVLLGLLVIGPPARTPAGLVDRPAIRSRAEWGAHEPGSEHVCPASPSYPICLPSGRTEQRYDPSSEEGREGYAPYAELKPGSSLAEILDTVVIHHEGNTATHDVKQIQEQHMAENGWYDIGYHYIVAADGTIYEGRDIGVRGRHVEGANTGKVGVLLLGDFERHKWDRHNWWDFQNDRPTAAQLESTRRLIRWLDSEYRITEVTGHNDFKDTECPGDELEPHIESFNEVAQEQ